MGNYRATVSGISWSGSDIAILRLSFAGGVPFTFKPGQYILVYVKAGEESHIKPYSIASPPSEKGFIELCIKVVPEGVVSHYMSSMKGGETIEISGPGGIFTLQEEIKNDIIFAATGTGISSLKPMIETIFEQGTSKEVFLFFGAKTAGEILYRKGFESLARKHRNFHFIPVVSQDPGFPGEKGHVQDIIPKYVKSPRGKDLYICGVLKMVEETIRWAEGFGFEKRKIHFEKYV